MNQYKHICNLEYCKKHSLCIFKNAEDDLRSDAYIISLGEKVCSDRIICHQKQDIGLEDKKPSSIEIKMNTDGTCRLLYRPSHQKAVRGLVPLININRNTSNTQLIRCSNIYCGTSKELTRHHLIPKRYRAGVTNAGRIIYLCVDCHKKVHNLKSNYELATHYNTKQAVVELLSSDVYFRLERFVNVAKQELCMVA